MKIDKVLEAHGIGIVQLSPPVIPTTGIVTNGLVGYWNSKQGVDKAWANIAPATQGQYEASIFQIAVTTGGMMFNGSTSYVQLPVPTELKTVTSATFELRMQYYGGVADMINQGDGRELIWNGDNYIVLSGIFDADKYSDKYRLWGSTDFLFKDIYLTVTADLTTGRVTAYLHDPSTGKTDGAYYTTTIGTLTNGDFLYLSDTNVRYGGILDNIRMYNRVLTQEEIARNWSVGAELGI